MISNLINLYLISGYLFSIKMSNKKTIYNFNAENKHLSNKSQNIHRTHPNINFNFHHIQRLSLYSFLLFFVYATKNRRR